MRLLYSSSSPFARKTRVAVREKNLLHKVDEIECNPFSSPASLLVVNRLSKVPALLTDDGLCLYDSPVIVAYIDSLSASPILVPSAGPQRWIALRTQALSDGMMELGVAITLEKRRPPAEQSANAAKRWQSQIVDALAVAEVEITTIADRVTIGHIAIAVALGYLDFRGHARSWRADHPELFGWYREFSEHESMRATAPSDYSYNL